MKELVILGAGKIGRMVCHLMANSGDYDIRIGDVAADAVDDVEKKYDNVNGQVVDFEDRASVGKILEGAWAVISCAPFHCNPRIARAAKEHGVHYFDLTEDVAVTQAVKELADGAETLFAPQCGLAPGFITIVANYLMSSMTDVTDLRLRVGALPIDTLALSAHKLHGPKGVGALYIRRGCDFSPLLVGGGQEGRRRAGTENVPGIVGFGRAAELALNALASRDAVQRLRDRLEHGALEALKGVHAVMTGEDWVW